MFEVCYDTDRYHILYVYVRTIFTVYSIGVHGALNCRRLCILKTVSYNRIGMCVRTVRVADRHVRGYSMGTSIRTDISVQR